MSDRTEKLWIIGAIALAAIVCLAIVGTLFVVGLKNLDQLASSQSGSPDQTPPPYPSPENENQFLPLVQNNVIETAQPTPAVSGDKWKVISIEENAFEREGYLYDVAVFENVENSSVTLRAQCAEPTWPAPEIGTVYFLNEAGVLIPVTDNESNDPQLQRFIVLDW